jgi:hypothetical protein
VAVLTTLAQRFAHYAGEPGDDAELRKRRSIVVAFLIAGVFVWYSYAALTSPLMDYVFNRAATMYAQKAMLKQLADSVKAIAVGSEHERGEVADAIDRKSVV